MFSVRCPILIAISRKSGDWRQCQGLLPYRPFCVVSVTLVTCFVDCGRRKGREGRWLRDIVRKLNYVTTGAARTLKINAEK